MGIDREQLSTSLRAKGLVRTASGEWAKVLSKGSGPVTKLESYIGPRPLEPTQVEERPGQKFFVRITSFRRKLIDEDNLCEKYHVDLCRYAGALPSDAPKETRIKVNQEKVKTQEEERVEIAIYEV